MTADGRAVEPGGQHPTPTRPVGAAPAAHEVEDHVRAARSVDCACQAPAGAACSPAGDHLARYLRAWQAGTLTRQSLNHAIESLDVIAPHAVVGSPTGHARAATAAQPQPGGGNGPQPARGPAEPELEAG